MPPWLQHYATMSPQKTLKTLTLRISEVLLGLSLLTWYSLHITGGCLHDLFTLLLRPLSVFLISNAIIVTVAVLSGEAGTTDANSNSSYRSHHLAYAEFSGEKAAVDVSYAVSGEVVVTVPPPKDDPEEVRCLILAEEADGGGQQLWESTAVCDEERREKVADGGAREEGDTDTAVEDLSEEEFNRTVEKYIALTRSFLHKERLDDDNLK